MNFNAINVNIIFTLHLIKYQEEAGVHIVQNHQEYYVKMTIVIFVIKGVLHHHIKHNIILEMKT